MTFPIQDVLVAIFPIVLLVFLMAKRKSMPSYYALPLVAVLLYLLKIFYFESDLELMNATVVEGLLTAWTPILVVWGAIFIFESMENTGGLNIIRKWLNYVTTNKVGQLMIIGWAFMFLVEGASGFGTPAALAAPLLVGLGFRPLKVAVFCLIMNSIPVTFGAVGIPVWFGLGQLGLSESELLMAGFKAGIIHFAAALVIPLIALSFVVKWREVFKNIGFIYLSILSCTVPYLALAYYNYEFPSLVGGAFGLVLTVLFAIFGIGLRRGKKERFIGVLRVPKLVRALFPIWGTIILLVATRIKQFGIGEILTSTAHTFEVGLGGVVDFSVSSSLVLGLKNIFGTGVNWSHSLLYVPSLIPFFLVGFLSFLFFRGKKGVVKKTWNEAWGRIKKPILALSGALVFVKLLMVGGDGALTMIIGKTLADLAGNYWQFFASYLGALGAFFAGSNTISNLTFGGIQQAVAQDLGLNVTTILGAQSAGGAMGNMICIANIVAVCSVLNLKEKMGEILKRTVVPMLIYGVIAGVVSFGLDLI
ncbi:MAG: L-lactate permease [Candidatus Peregrinibacteria bacterium]